MMRPPLPKVEQPSWIAEVDPSQNLLVVRYGGRVGPDQTRQCAEEIQAALSKLEPEFQLLVDLTALESMEVSCAPHIRNIMEMCNEKGVAEVVRIIPDPKQDIGLRIMSYFHYGSDVKIVTCASAAEAMAELTR